MADIYTISSTTTNTLNPIRDKSLYSLVDGSGSSTIVNKLTSALTSSISSQTASNMNLVPVINDGKMQGMDISTFKDILYPVEHEYVEIGGVKWATMNIGATAVTDTGLYFQWGDTNGYLSGQCGSSGTTYAKPFTITAYKFSGGRSISSDSAMTKYNNSDRKTVLDICDDAARANWGGSWRMPTKDEYAALGASVNTAWTQVDGVNGILCIDKTNPSKTLFFPACGYLEGGSLDYPGRVGDYWTSSRYSVTTYAYHLNFGSSFLNWGNGSSERNRGLPVRGVIG